MGNGQLLLIFHSSAVMLCALRVLYKQRNTGTAFAWLILLFVVPLFGVLLYILLGEPRLGSARAKRQAEMKRFYRRFAEQHLDALSLDVREHLPEPYRGISKVASGDIGLGVTGHNHLQLISSTDAIIDTMIGDIRAAQQSCLLAFYIIDPKGRIDGLLEAVADAARRGVECVLLADAVGSSGFFDSEWPQKLQEAGAAVHQSLPVGPLRTLFTRSDLRNHRKMLITDKRVAYTGSFNLVDPKFFKQGAGVGEWVDVMMRCTGPLVLEMVAVFYADVAAENNETMNDVQQYLGAVSDSLPARLEQSMQAGTVCAQVIPSAPEQADRIIYETILCALYSAQREIIITTPYFVPDDPLLTAFTAAAKRGVDITLILPAKVDSLMVRYASRAYYPMLLEAGVKIALFDGGLLHAKTMTVDGVYSLFGTVNMDLRSMFLNLEISLAVYDAHSTVQIIRLQQDYLQNCRYISIKGWQQRAKWWGLVENTVRLLSPLL